MAPCCSEANPRLHVSLHWKRPLIRVRLCLNSVCICVFWRSELFILAIHSVRWVALDLMGTDLANYCLEFDLICLILFFNETTQIDEPKNDKILDSLW